MYRQYVSKWLELIRSGAADSGITLPPVGSVFAYLLVILEKSFR